MGRPIEDIPVLDELECGLGTTAKGDESVFGPSWGQRLLVRLFCRRSSRPELLRSTVQAAADNKHTLVKHANRRSTLDRWTGTHQRQQPIRRRVWTRLS